MVMPPNAAHAEPPTDESPSQGWSSDDLAQSPHADAHKAEKVRSMFGAIAKRYDLNNRLHSFGRDQAWRRRAVRAAEVRAGDAVLDMACGTGDLTLLLAKTSDATRVVGGDFTPEMLAIAREKNTHGKIEYEQADAMDLPFAAKEFNALTIAFGIRNVTDPAKALTEFHRVLKPGGRLVILEFATPPSKLVRAGNSFYTKCVMPLTAGLIARDRTGAYRYLPRSIETFLQPPAMIEAMENAGFTDVSAHPMTFGVCVCYRGYRAG